MAHKKKKVSRKKDYWVVSSGLENMILQKVGNSYPPSWCFSWYPLITGLGSTNISSKKLLQSPWHLVITSLQSLLIGVCAGGSNPAQGGTQGGCRQVRDQYGAASGILALLSLMLMVGSNACWGYFNKPAMIFFGFLSDYPAKEFGSILISASRGITISLLLSEATALPGMKHEYFMGLVLGRLLMVEFSWPITRFLWLSALLW